MTAATLGPLLNGRIHEGFDRGVSALAAVPSVRSVVPPSATPAAGFSAAPALFAVRAADLLKRRGLLVEECFGPTALIVEYASPDELLAALGAVPGSLTTTVHA